jgi:hypothetical protein
MASFSSVSGREDIWVTENEQSRAREKDGWGKINWPLMEGNVERIYRSKGVDGESEVGG